MPRATDSVHGSSSVVLTVPLKRLSLAKVGWRPALVVELERVFSTAKANADVANNSRDLTADDM